MQKMKYFWGGLIFVVCSFVFMILEYGRLTFLMDELIQPVIFAFMVTIVFLNGKSRPLVLWFSGVLLVLMVVFYLFNLLSLSSWIGSLGLGILVILIFSYLPNLIKYGHI